MGEYVRSIELDIEIDTNKRTEKATFTGDSVADVLDQAKQWLRGLICE